MLTCLLILDGVVLLVLLWTVVSVVYGTTKQYVALERRVERLERESGH